MAFTYNSRQETRAPIEEDVQQRVAEQATAAGGL